MDFKDTINQLALRVEKLKSNIQTEEATKNAFIMPFLQSLGYDVFNPLEVIPEFTCDIGTKKGEKVDYAIIREGNPIILVECKHWSQDLTLFDNQLLRYFHVTTAKFGLLTNGIIYRFYTDLKEPNKMDEKPFLEVNILDLKDFQISELKKFHKSYFDIEGIYSSANELKYINELKLIIQNEFGNPSPEFVKLLVKQVYDGIATQKVLDQFTPLLKKTISTYINDLITDRIKGALTTEKEKQAKEESIQDDKDNSDLNNTAEIVTTQEEIEGYLTVKAILRKVVDIERITHRDALSYFAILFDDNNRKPVCRLYFNGQRKYVGTFDENKKETKHLIESLDDIYLHGDELQGVIKNYIE